MGVAAPKHACVRVYKGDGKEYVVRFSQPVDSAEWHKLASAPFHVDECVLRDSETGGMLLSDSAVAMLLHDFALLAHDRKLDVLASWTTRAVGRLGNSEHAAQRAVGAQELTMALADASFEVRTNAAAALFALATVAETLERMPHANITRALLRAATLGSTSETPPERVVWLSGALNRFIGTTQGGIAFATQGGVRAMLPLLKTPRADVRRATVVLLTTALEEIKSNSLSDDVLIELVELGGPDLVAIITSGDDAASVKFNASFVLAHAVRRMTRSIKSGAAAAAYARRVDILVDSAHQVVDAMELIRAELSAAPDDVDGSRTQTHALLEATSGVLWSIAACLAHMPAPLLLPDATLVGVLGSALKPDAAGLGTVAAGILSYVEPREEDAAAAGGIVMPLLSYLEQLFARGEMRRRHQVVGAALANWLSLPSEHNAAQREDGLARLLRLCAIIHEHETAAGRLQLKPGSLQLSLHTSLSYAAMRLCTGDMIDRLCAVTPVSHEIIELTLRLVQASKSGVLFGASCLFGILRNSRLHAHPTPARLIGAAGGVELLLTFFRRALDSGREHVPSSWEHSVAHLVAVAIWLLIFDDEVNAATCVRIAGDMLLSVTGGARPVSPETTHVCVGILSKAMRMHFLTEPLLKDCAGDVLCQIGREPRRAGTERVLAACGMRNGPRVTVCDASAGELCGRSAMPTAAITCFSRMPVDSTPGGMNRLP